MLQNLKLKELSFIVYGLGLSGRSVVNFFKKRNIKNFKVWDDNNKRIFKKHRVKNLRKSLSQVDYIILSPGISLIKNKQLRKFKKKIITDIDLFYLVYDKFKSIVVTGTNGKSTTCKLLAHLFKKNKLRYALGGNIGNPILNVTSPYNRYVIIEASSFQLEYSKFICPDYALFLNLTNDHLDWHGSAANYMKSKLKIFSLQKKKHSAIINKRFKKIFQKKKFLSKLIIPNNNDYEKIKYQIRNNYLTSSINDENMNFVYTISKLFKIRKKHFIDAMQTFKGLPHRFEIFLSKGNTTFINDSKATSFSASKYALSSLKNIYWIIGGLPKKGDKLNLRPYQKNIIKSYIIGKHVNFFKKQITGRLPFSTTKNLEKSLIQILEDCKLKKNIKKFVLLSPSAASFDQFKDFERRGLKFKKLSKKYARKLL